MHTGRTEAYSDAVIAIIMTVMVLELRAPDGPHLSDLAKAAPTLLLYSLSFVFLAIYWNNHHHMLSRAKYVNGKVLWANMHLLFWLSLIPFTTGWMGHHPLAPEPIAVYGIDLLASGLAYYILSRALIGANGEDSGFAKALGNDLKGKISPFLYLFAVLLASFAPAASLGLYVLIALMWLVPDRRFEVREEL